MIHCSGRRAAALASLLAWSAPVGAAAEETESAPAEDSEWKIFPVLGGNTDIGFQFGLLGTFASFDGSTEPYAWSTTAQVSASVKGGPDGAELPTHDHFFRLDIVELLGGRLRLFPAASYYKVINAGYYGIGNATSDVIATGYDSRWYQYARTEAGARVDARYAVSESLALQAGLRGRYVNPDPYPCSRLESDLLATEAGALPRECDLLATEAMATPRIWGADRHALVQVALGVAWDTRDDEIWPTRGSFHEVSLRYSPGALTGAEHHFAGVTVQARFYVDVAGRYLVVAGRVIGDVMVGRVPFYELENAGAFSATNLLGSGSGVRGVPSGRYRGRTKVAASLELRSLFIELELFGSPMIWGLATVADMGRVWAGHRPRQRLDGSGLGLKIGLGGGPRLQWGKTVVVRFDFVYSPDADPIGAYFTLGHAF